MRKPVPDFDAFSERAQALAKAIPAEFMQGIESVDVHRENKASPLLEDVLTLGECATSPLSQITGEEQFHSTVHLYYGSFVELAQSDPSFDVEHELAETIEHEIQHHIEDRAGIKTLRDEDDLFEAHARFKAGMEVQVGWYRMGEPQGPGVWAVDLDLFVELDLRKKEWDARRGKSIALEVLGQPLEFDLPADADSEEVFTLEGDGLFQPDEELAEGEEPDEDAPGTAGDLHVIPRVR